MAVKFELTWEEFNELRALLETINAAKTKGANHGEISTSIMEAEWASRKIQIKMEID